jgi:hypothetical protein
MLFQEKEIWGADCNLPAKLHGQSSPIWMDLGWIGTQCSILRQIKQKVMLWPKDHHSMKSILYRSKIEILKHQACKYCELSKNDTLLKQQLKVLKAGSSQPVQ